MTTNELIATTRTRLGLSAAQVAQQAGMSLESYYDVESHASEVTSVISLASLLAICKQLEMTPKTVLGGQPSLGYPVSIDARTSSGHLIHTDKELQKWVRDSAHRLHSSLEDMSKECGWDLSELCADPHAVWNWTVDCLFSVCVYVGADGMSLLEAAFDDHGGR